jgi:2-polyprenyl-3-methyl-5-hydroxy-6-metoxy-1,4-benzoquinol methylase
MGYPLRRATAIKRALKQHLPPWCLNWAYGNVHLFRILRERFWYNRRELMNTYHTGNEWNFDRPLEYERHRKTLELITAFTPDATRVHSLEVGCAQGQFTRQLAAHCATVTACDVSSVACERAAQSCEDLPNVTVLQFDLQRDNIQGQYDWIFVMDVFWYLHGRDLVAIAVEKLARAVKPGGYLIVSDSRLPEHLRHRWWIRWFPEGADALLEFMNGRSGLRLVQREFHPNDGIQAPAYMDHIIALFAVSS